MPRYETLYSHALGTDGRKRHLIRAAGESATFPKALCGDRVALRDSRISPACSECEMVRLTELTLTLEGMGLHELAVELAKALNARSFETVAAQTG